MSAYIEAK